jgi:C-terminal processing protease CtpA/Prc
VKEGSRADRAGLKLGDAIVTINGKETADMTLQQANNLLEQSQQKDVNMEVMK